MKIAKGAVIGASVLAAIGVAVPGFAGGNKYEAVAAQADCGSGNVVNWLGATTLWPPNHKFQPASVQAVDASGDNVTIEIDPVITDAVGGDGGAKHDPDVTYTSSPVATGAGSALVDFALRSERSGRGEGRTYTINWVATFDNGSDTCTSNDDGQDPFVAFVPHDMRDKNN